MSAQHSPLWSAEWHRGDGEPSDGPGYWTIEGDVGGRTGVIADTLNRDHLIGPEEDRAHAHVLAAAADLLALARKVAGECAECDGAGVIEVLRSRTVAECCSRPNDDGSCCGNPVPAEEPYIDQDRCPACADVRAVIAKAVPA